MARPLLMTNLAVLTSAPMVSDRDAAHDHHSHGEEKKPKDQHDHREAQ